MQGFLWYKWARPYVNIYTNSEYTQQIISAMLLRLLLPYEDNADNTLSE